MECIQVSPANSFLGLVESSPKIDPNSKYLYRKMNEIWQSMHQYFCQMDKQGSISKTISIEDLTSIVMMAFVKRRFMIFHVWLEKQSELMTTQLDFPVEMVASIQAIYMETLIRLSETLQDESFGTAMKASEQRLCNTFLTCASHISAMRTLRLYGEYLSKRWILNQDPYSYPNFDVNLERAVMEEMRGDIDLRQSFSPFFESKTVNLKFVQMRYSLMINRMFNDYMAGMVRRIQTIYKDAKADVITIQFWRTNQVREKRKLEDDKEDLQKRVKSAEEHNSKLNAYLDDLLGKCQLITAELEELRSIALKKMDENALAADEVARSHMDMGKDLLRKNDQLAAQLEALTKERNVLKEKLTAKGLFGGIFS